MVDKKKNIIYSKADIDNYLQGKMPYDEMHLLERAALQDAFLADAIEGYSSAEKAATDIHLSEIDFLIAGNKLPAKVVSLAKAKPKWINVAAATVLFAGLGWLSFKLMSKENNRNSVTIAEKKSATKQGLQQAVDSIILPQKSVATNLNKNKSKEVFFTDVGKETKGNNNSLNVISGNATVKSNLADNGSVDTKNYTASNFNGSNQYGPSTSNASVNYSYNFNTPNDSAITKEQFLATANNVQEKKIAESVTVNYAPKKVFTNTNFSTATLLKKIDDSTANITSEKANSAVKKMQNNTYKMQQTNLPAMPINGWDAFNEYIKKNGATVVLNEMNNVLKTDTVTNKPTMIVFDIDKNGSPKKIKILQSAGVDNDQKSIDLIKNGSKWKTSNKKQKGNVSILWN